jgi:hypothetical protein
MALTPKAARTTIVIPPEILEAIRKKAKWIQRV